MNFQNQESSVASRQALSDGQATRWESIVAMTTQTFHFTPEETRAFASCRTARLIGELPFIAGCEDAERTSLAHLAIYITAIRGGRFVFDHRRDDNGDICSRLRLINSFVGGNTLIIEHGMKLLALVMVCGYNRDREKDEAEGFYNPLNDGSWDFDKISSALKARIKEISSPAIEAVLPLAAGPTAIWY